MSTDSTTGDMAVGESIGRDELDLSPGSTIGPYKLRSTLGEGGFGVVYLGEQSEPVQRRVALKVIKPGMDSKAVVARFEQERQALAVMDHPNVARVLDAGTTERGLPYFAMEYVKGEPITDYCDRHNLTIHDRLELFISVCEAVQHAHMKGIIHRDIKPSNVLVAVGDSGPNVKVIDFGVAKALSHTFTQATIFTEHGQLIGTPDYMSPEQAEMGATDIDTRTDVYSLGVLLYELLTGSTPFDPRSLREAGYAEIQRIIREVDPPKPSTRFSSLGEQSAAIAGHRQAKREELLRELSRELDWIPLKAMRKDRMDRYRTAIDFADDIKRYLNGEVLEAGPEAVTYRLRKLVQRHKGPVTAVAAVIFVLLGGIIGTTWGMQQARLATAAEAEHRHIAEDRVHDIQELLSPFTDEYRASSRVWASNFIDGLNQERPYTSGWDAVVVSTMYAEVARRVYESDQIELGYVLGAIAMLLEGVLSVWGDAEHRELGEPLLRDAIDLLAQAEIAEPWEVAALYNSLFALLRQDGRGLEAIAVLQEGAAELQRRDGYVLSEVLLTRAKEHLNSDLAEVSDHTWQHQLRETYGRLADLYDTWHQAEPQGGYQVKAAALRENLEAMEQQHDGPTDIDAK